MIKPWTFSEMEAIEKRYLININLNTTDREVKFLQGYLAEMI